jgi:hypothetical protein
VNLLAWAGVRRDRERTRLLVFALAFAGAYAGGIVALELLFVLQGKSGFNLQGRYFLPASLGVCLLALGHGRRWAQALLLAYLLAFNLASFRLTATRYYEHGFADALEALPFAPGRPSGP